VSFFHWTLDLMENTFNTRERPYVKVPSVTIIPNSKATLKAYRAQGMDRGELIVGFDWLAHNEPDLLTRCLKMKLSGMLT